MNMLAWQQRAYKAGKGVGKQGDQQSMSTYFDLKA
jgi:hypothetical protein